MKPHLLALSLAVLTAAAIAEDPSVANNIAQLTAQAAAGDAGAQYRLACRYSKGDGITQDYGKAIAWLEKAAAQNHPNAAYNLGALYGDGTVAPKDTAKARQWLEKAAAQGHEAAPSPCISLTNKTSKPRQAGQTPTLNHTNLKKPHDLRTRPQLLRRSRCHRHRP